MNRITKVAVAAVAALGLALGAVAMYHHTNPPRPVAMHVHGIHG